MMLESFDGPLGAPKWRDPVDDNDNLQAVASEILAATANGPKVAAPPPREIIVFGNSHTNALRVACLNAEFAAEFPDVADFAFYVFGHQNKWFVRSAFFDSLRMAWEPNAAIMSTLFYLGGFQGGPENLLISAYGGNGHNVIGMLEHERPFDFVYPGRPDLPVKKQSELIPYGMVRSLLSERLKANFVLLSAIKAATGRTMIHVESPPPNSVRSTLSESTR